MKKNKILVVNLSNIVVSLYPCLPTHTLFKWMNNIKNIFYLNLYLTRYSLSFLVFYGKQGEQRPQKLPYQILGGTTLENVQIDPRTTEILPKKLNVPLVREWVLDVYLNTEKLSLYFMNVRWTYPLLALRQPHLENYIPTNFF